MPEQMTPDQLAAIHAAAFTGLPRPWSAAEFTDTLAHPATHLLTRPGAFLVARRAGPEVEILTLCTDPAHRRSGLAAGLLTALITWARDQGAEDIFLEVAQSNTAAKALYAQAGFVSAGIRKDYYTGQGKTADHALVLSRPVDLPTP